MVIHTHHFPAADVLKVEVSSQGRAHVPFLKWKISPKGKRQRNADSGHFAGPGIYGVCFDDRLIYVGSFLGSGGTRVDRLKAATFAGDIVQGRWWQHFGSITGRSHKLSVASKTVIALEAEVGADHPMVDAFRRAEPDLSNDAGCLGALNRLRFAAHHFNDFAGEHSTPEGVLSRFSYLYARFDSVPQGSSVYDLSQHIADVEDSLIKRIHPVVNTAGRTAEGVPEFVSRAQAARLIKAALKNTFPATVIG